MAFDGRKISGRLSEVVLHLAVRPSLQQHLDNVGVAIHASTHQRRLFLAGRDVRVGVRIEEGGDDGFVAKERRAAQRRVRDAVGRIEPGRWRNPPDFNGRRRH